jgi:hypothetical protein
MGNMEGDNSSGHRASGADGRSNASGETASQKGYPTTKECIMKTKPISVVILALALSCFAFPQQGLCSAPSSVGCTENAGLIITDPSAPGTSLAGTLTLYFTGNDPECGAGGFNCFGDVYWFMRIKKGNTTYAFSGSFYGNYNYAQSCTPIPDEGEEIKEIIGIQTSLEEAVQLYVLPVIYVQEVPRENWALQAFTNWQQPSDDPAFVMADFVLAVKKP